MKIALILAIFLWVLSAVLVLSAPAPIEEFGGEGAEPAKVKPGGTVTVTRNFRILNNAPLRVTRSMIKGDCNKSCEIVDLHGSALTLPKGDYRNIKREHSIPVTVSEGKWRLAFSVHWSDMIGRDRHIKLKEIEIEVIR